MLRRRGAPATTLRRHVELIETLFLIRRLPAWSNNLLAVEVKSAATVHKGDFRGLAFLRDKLGRAFKAGALLYTGANTLPFGDRLAAVPMSGLWTGAS